MKKYPLLIVTLGLAAWIWTPSSVGADSPPAGNVIDPVPFDEVQRLIRQHLAETSDEELNAAAVKGLIEQLKPHVVLGHQAATTVNTNALVAGASRFRRDFGYLRIGVVEDGLRAALKEAIDRLLEDGPLQGLVLDLRFTGGTNYRAAASATALFTTARRPLLQIDAEVAETEPVEEPVLIPVMALTNGSTAGAGEALAAALRYIKAGLIIGGKTAGEAMLFEEFPLSNGQVIRIASKAVQLGNGRSIPRSGLTPDIVVSSTPEEDRRYLDNPYWEDASGTAISAPSLRRRITEADLVRQRREGIPLQSIISNTAETASSGPRQVRDPVLGRALDMLKALSVVQTWKKEGGEE